MNVGKTLFAQVVEYVPWKTFGRIVERYEGDVGVRTMSCTDLFRVMVFSQLTWRESLRDIDAARICASLRVKRWRIPRGKKLWRCDRAFQAEGRPRVWRRSSCVPRRVAGVEPGQA